MQTTELNCPCCESPVAGVGECGCVQFECDSVDARNCDPGRVLAFYHECEGPEMTDEEYALWRKS